VINDGTNRYVYDPEGRICAVWSPGPVYTQYVYDANGQRVAKGTIPATDWPTAGNTCNAPTAANGFTLTAQYLRGQSGDQDIELTGSGQLAHQNIFEGGGLAATYWNYNSPAVPEYELSYNFNDWLGSKRLQTNNNPSAEAYWRSDPFGNYLTAYGTEADSTGTTAPIHFTGKERDTESGLDYFGARYYGSSMGRWMSPDPAGIGFADAENPQSLNLYGYVHNNPLAFVDPNGMLACPDGKWQDVACAVQTIGHAIGSFFSGLGGGGGDNSSVTTSETYSVDPGGSGGSSGGSTFQQMWNNYPRYSQYPSERNGSYYSGPGSFWQHAGGHQEMNATTFKNSCSLRMCYALNRSGVRIPYAPGRVSDGDHMWGIPRLTDLQPFLIQNFGQPKQYSPNSWRGQLAGQTGIVMFQVNIWSDASGHTALWNGQQLSDGGEHDYTNVSSGVLFWPIP